MFVPSYSLPEDGVPRRRATVDRELVVSTIRLIHPRLTLILEFHWEHRTQIYFFTVPRDSETRNESVKTIFYDSNPLAQGLNENGSREGNVLVELTTHQGKRTKMG